MNSASQILAAEFELLKADIIAAYEAGEQAGGNWAETVTAAPTQNGYSITAAPYITGRGPGKAPPSSAIEAWIIKKGIASRLEKGMTISSLAFLIARKIARLGWKPKAGTSDGIEGVVTAERIQDILDKAGETYLSYFISEITNYLKQAAL